MVKIIIVKGLTEPKKKLIIFTLLCMASLNSFINFAADRAIHHSFKYHQSTNNSTIEEMRQEFSEFLHKEIMNNKIELQNADEYRMTINKQLLHLSIVLFVFTIIIFFIFARPRY